MPAVMLPTCLLDRASPCLASCSRQARALGKHIRALGPAFRADAIIVSPLTRTLETAAGVFGAGPWQSGDPQPPLMREQVGGKKDKEEGGSWVARVW